MAASVVSTTHAANGGTASITFTSVNADGGNAVVAVITTRDAGGLTRSGSTWNGSSDAPDESSEPAVQDGVQHLVYAWQGLTGTASLAITFTGTVNDIEGWAFVISGADTSDIIGTPVTSGATGSSPLEVTVAGDSNDIVISAIRLRVDAVASLAPVSGQTALDGPQLSGNGNTIMTSWEAGGASVTSGYTFADPATTAGQLLAVNVNGTGGVASPNKMLFLGVG